MTDSIRNKARKVDRNWDDLFNNYDILNKVSDNGFFLITSDEINHFKHYRGQRIDARNMTKFDYKNSLPDIFFNNNLSILPTKRGEYIIGEFKAYQDIDASDKVFRSDRREVEFPQWIESLDYSGISTENAMLNTAILSGMLHDLFNADELVETVNGRMGSRAFDFKISNNAGLSVPISVSKSQIEIDGGYETYDKLILVEAKNNITNNFLIRQLYYPYRLWKGLINKKIVPVYLQYNNGVFNFSLFDFKDQNNYSSIYEIGRYNYIISEKQITRQDIIDAYKRAKVVPEPNVTFPQANTFERIFDLLNTVYENGEITKEEITLVNNFTLRQADYYFNAGRYLSLLEANDGLIGLTDKGIKVMNLGTRERKLAIVEAIFQHEPFRKAFEIVLNRRITLTQTIVYDALKNDSEYMPEFKDSTRNRRSSTIAGWINRIMKFIDDY